MPFNRPENKCFSTGSVRAGDGRTGSCGTMAPMSQASSELWEEAADCGVCGSSKSRLAWVICNRRFVVCEGCGVHRLYDRVAERRLDLLYADYYPEADPSRQELERQLENPTFGYRHQRIEACRETRDRRILEVGCGDGNFLGLMRRSGWEVSGLEFSASTRDLVNRRHDIPVFVGEVASVSIDRPFPVVAAYHVIEHVYHPADWLQHVRRVIEPDGLLHLQTPNVASATRHATGLAWASMVFPQHVYLFAPATLGALLERSGFSVSTMTTWDPWHGPGVVESSLSQAGRRLITGRLPWSDTLGAPVQNGSVTRETSERPTWQTSARRLLGRVARPLARAEAAIGCGSVVDIIARRREESR